MGFHNPGISWTELEAKLSGRPSRGSRPGQPWTGDAPWSSKRGVYESESVEPVRSATPYA